ncbi:MAG: MFS transporter [Acidobacteriota bacterium]|nr:MFS transporter [Acidobacteriota bacterium]
MHHESRNLRLYPLYALAFNCYAWTPVFFLYFSQNLPLAAVLRLEALYYAAVVLLEVPSGYFSDRVGRKATLLISSTAMCLSYALFTLGGSFEVFAAAQVLLAVGISFNSGTDVSFHYDSLAELGRAGEFGAREARITRNNLFANGFASFAGGAVALFALRYAYALSFATALVGLVVALFFKEPGRDHRQRAAGFLTQLGRCLACLRNPLLAWLFFYCVGMIILDHIPYELYQPYLDLLGERAAWLPQEGTPLTAGLVMAVSLFLGAPVAGYSIRLRDKLGLKPALLSATLMQTVVIASMGWFLHPLVVALILLRNVPAALKTAPLNAAIAPRVDTSLRATYLSLQSLVGRLSFSITLAGLSLMFAPGDHPDWPALSRISQTSTVIGVALLLLLIVSIPFTTQSKAEET